MFSKITKKFKFIALAIVMALLSACSSVSNLTPHKVVESENGVYTLSMAAKIDDNARVYGSEKAYIVIDGERHLMKTVLNLRNEVMYQYDYTFPKGRDFVSYYYVVDYKARINHGRTLSPRSIDSGEMFVLKPLTKVVNAMKKESGKLGDTVAIQGVGFKDLDVVLVGGKEAQTKCLSRNTLEFAIPSLEAGKRYDVEIKRGDAPLTWAGSLLITPRDILVSPSKISKESGQMINMIFDLGIKAPVGGFYVDVQTNIPSSIIMPEVIVEEGESSVVVPVKFAADGNGTLFINALGFREVKVDVSVDPVAMTEIELVGAQDDLVIVNSISNEEAEIEEAEVEDTQSEVEDTQSEVEDTQSEVEDTQSEVGEPSVEETPTPPASELNAGEEEIIILDVSVKE